MALISISEEHRIMTIPNIYASGIEVGRYGL